MNSALLEHCSMQIIEEETRIYLREQKCFVIMETERLRVEEINAQILNEISLGDLGHFALDVVGAVPGAGEAADLANAALYAGKGQFFMAALSAISMVPAVGDAVGKGGKIATFLAKGGGGEKAAKAFVWLKDLFSKHWPKIKSTFSKLKKNKYIGKHIDDMLGAVSDFLKTPEDSEESMRAVSQAANVSAPIDAASIEKGKDALEKASPDKEKAVKHQKEK